MIEASTAEGEIAQVVLPPAHVEADAHDQREIPDDDGKIEGPGGVHRVRGKGGERGLIGAKAGSI
jgi:hypothetical protein